MKVGDFFNEIEFAIGAVIVFDVLQGNILIVAPAREVLVEKLSVFLEKLFKIDVFIGGKTVHERNAEMEKGVGIYVVEIVLVF